MRKPNVAKPRSAAAAFSLSRTLPRLKLPLGAAARSAPRPYPVIGKPAPPAAQVNPADPLCHRCSHGQSQHPVRYVCDKYPHPDPLKICGCESERLEDVCSQCGHTSRRHKARHRCREGACKCWAFDASAPC